MPSFRQSRPPARPCSRSKRRAPGAWFERDRLSRRTPIGERARGLPSTGCNATARSVRLRIERLLEKAANAGLDFRRRRVGVAPESMGASFDLEEAGLHAGALQGLVE